MEIDPAALSRTTSNPAASSSAPFSSKNLPGSASKAGGKPAQQLIARVDLEPLYTSLKSIIADNWGTYKDAISRFVLGYLSQEELSRQLDLIILSEPSTVHLHNQLMCAIYANILRDGPETAVASWVSANDKPTSVSKPPTGDAAEQRLKSEVMHLPHRMRHRLKSIQDDPQQPLIHSLLSTTYARSLVQPAGASLSAPASGGLSKDLEIRRRYALPLAAETEDIPSSSTLSDRILPICYEEGLPSGLSSPETCADLLATALDTFLKEAITDIVSRTRCNPPLSTPKPDATLMGANNVQAKTSKDGVIKYSTDGPVLGITTNTYKQKIAKEEEAFARGEIKRSEAGLLPVEQATANRIGSGKMAPGDFNLAWETGGIFLKGMAPWLGESTTMDREYRQDVNGEEKHGEQRNGVAGEMEDRALTNGVAAVNGHTEHQDDDAMVIDENDWGWHGASKSDRATLNSLLDDCLSIE